MIFVPLSAVAFSTLPESMRVEGAGLFSLLRTIGSSIGISIVITLFTRHTQIAWNQIGGQIQLYNPALQSYLHQINMDIYNPAATSILANELSRQAQMASFIDVYAFISWSFVIMIPLIFLIRVQKNKTAVEPSSLAME